MSDDIKNSDVYIQELFGKDINTPIIGKVAKLLAEGFYPDSEELWHKRFKFWWNSNPFLTDTDKIGWVLVSSSTGELKGFLGRIPVIYQCGTEQIKAVASTSWYVEREWSDKSAALYISFTRDKEANLLINNTPTSQIQKTLPKMKFRRISDVPVTNYLKFQKSKDFLNIASLILKEKTEKTTGIMHYCYYYLHITANIVAKTIPNIRININKDDQNKMIISPVEKCDELFSNIDKHKREKEIGISKDYKTLNWLLFSPEIKILSERNVMSISSKDGEYCGYFVYDIKKDVHRDLNYLVVRDIDLVNHNKDATLAITRYLHNILKRNGCSHYVINSLYIHDDIVRKVLNKKIRIKSKNITPYFVMFKNLKKYANGEETLEKYRASGLDPDAGFV